MEEVKIKFTLENESGTMSFSEIVDMSEQFHEWITNGANGAKEEVLSRIKEGTFKLDEVDKDSIAYGYIEYLAQSREAPLFVFAEDNVKITVKCIKNDYVNSCDTCVFCHPVIVKEYLCLQDIQEPSYLFSKRPCEHYLNKNSER